MSTVYVASSMPIRDLETFFPAVDRAPALPRQPWRERHRRARLVGARRRRRSAGARVRAAGDLALYHDMNGLLAVSRLGVEATFVVLNNGGGGIFDFLPIARHRDGYEELFGTPTGLDLEKVAALYGLPFTRVASHAELGAALEGPGLVEVVLDRPRNVELHRQVFDRVAAAIA